MKRRLKCVLADGVEYDGNAFAGGQRPDTGGNVIDISDKGVMAPVRKRDLRFGIRANDTDDTRAEISRPLTHNDANPTGSSMHQNCLARLNPKDIV